MPVLNPTTIIEKGRLHFLIMDAPGIENVQEYVAVMKQYGATDLVRTCELSYDESVVKSSGIRCHDLAFNDGEAPPSNIIEEWLAIVDHTSANNACAAIHCVAGLGRAPVLVAVALIERGGMDNLDAIELLRSRRKGAINRKQLQYLRNYRRQTKKKGCCAFM